MAEKPPAPRPVCPKCHLAVREDQNAVSYEGAFYHRGCAPNIGRANDRKDDPFADTTPISI
ncbi:MAG: hypothetical protein ACRD01_16960 [Terriglobales bacterium]